jgi:hypothetical protein
MDTNPSETLRQAAILINSGQLGQAQPILLDFVRRDPNSERGWFLLSQVLPETKQQIDCLRMVLKINPANVSARQRLDQLEGRSQPGSAQPEKAPLASPEPAVTDTSARPQGTLSAEEISLLDAVASPPQATKQSPPTSRQKARQSKKASRLWLALAAGVVLILFAAVCVSGFWLVSNLPTEPLPVAQITRLTSAPTQEVTSENAVHLPPTWTPTFTPTITPTPTVTPTPQPSATPTFMVPVPTQVAQMEQIEQQVQTLRALPLQNKVPSYIVPAPVAAQMLENEVTSQGGIPRLADEAHALSALGLISPTYDLVKYALNGMVDNIGGFYSLNLKEIFILGLQFGGLERTVYAHEFDHALVDQQYNLSQLESSEVCTNNSDRCDAVKALIEGDATLLMRQWLEKYATPQDYREILLYQQPFHIIPEEAPPDFAVRSLNFPYENGLSFVQSLYNSGGWPTVDQAYQRPPETTEQILHPEKYQAGEGALPVMDVPLDTVLGEGWRKVDASVLGEWTTYLILADSADVSARLEDATAKNAAAGWGGDTYQVYYSEPNGNRAERTVLAAHWAWDQPQDASEFEKAMISYLGNRFHGTKLKQPTGSCWETSQQTACLFSKDTETLWVITPDQATLDKIMALYPNFR